MRVYIKNLGLSTDEDTSRYVILKPIKEKISYFK